MSKKEKSENYNRGSLKYYEVRAGELEEQRNKAMSEAEYYRTELAKAHELLGRVTHQLSERWDNVRLTAYYPTDNLHNKRKIGNPKGL